MKIGIDCRLWDETGVGRYIRNLVKELQILDKKNNYTLFVLSKDFEHIKYQISKIKNNLKFEIARFAPLRRPPRLRVETGIEASARRGNWKLIVVDIRWHTLEEQLRFHVILNKENLDLVHFPYISVPIFYNKPFVVTIHDLIPYHYPTGKASALLPLFYHIKRIGYKKALGNAVKKAKKIIVPLFYVKEDLVNTLNVSGEKIVITPEGFDANIKKGKVSENVLKASENPYFLYVGNAYPHKNLDILILGFSKLKGKEKLLLVGREDYFYKRLKEKNSKNLIFLHDVSDSDLFHLYSHSIAAVSSSLMEGFGLFPLEALVAGTVPVVSNIPSFREVCDDLAIYFNPKDSNDIAEKLMRALKLKDSEREEIKKKSEVRLKKFSWQKMAQQTLAVYEQVAYNS